MLQKFNEIKRMKNMKNILKKENNFYGRMKVAESILKLVKNKHTCKLYRNN